MTRTKAIPRGGFEPSREFLTGSECFSTMHLTKNILQTRAISLNDKLSEIDKKRHPCEMVSEYSLLSLQEGVRRKNGRLRKDVIQVLRNHFRFDYNLKRDFLLLFFPFLKLSL